MSKLNWASCKIRNKGTSAGDASEIVISNIVTEGIEFAGDGKQEIEIGNNQPVTEGYQRGFVVRVKGTKDDSGSAILGDSNVYSSPSSDTLQQALIELVGTSGADSVEIDEVYIMGENELSNGRREVVLSCQLETIDDSYTFS